MGSCFLGVSENIDSLNRMGNVEYIFLFIFLSEDTGSCAEAENSWDSSALAMPLLPSMLGSAVFPLGIPCGGGRTGISCGS